MPNKLNRLGFGLALLSILWMHAPRVNAQQLNTWYGEWKGMLDLYKPDGSVDRSIPMELLVKPTEDSTVVQWRITYNNKDVRNYLLKTKDVSKGQYTLDEQNGISIEMRKFGQVMMSNFEVQDFQINNTYELTGITIRFTLNSSTTRLHTQSGQGTEKVPTVKSIPPNVYQRAVLIRQ